MIHLEVTTDSRSTVNRFTSDSRKRLREKCKQLRKGWDRERNMKKLVNCGDSGVPCKPLLMKCYFPLYNVTLNIWLVHINMNSAVSDLWPRSAAEPLMTLQQLWLLFFQLADAVWMEQHRVWSVRRKHGQYAKDSVIREPQCVGREVSKAVNTSEVYPSLL